LKTFEEMQTTYDELATIINNPRLYLVNFFADIRNQIDIECQIYLDGKDLNEKISGQMVQLKFGVLVIVEDEFLVNSDT